VPATLKNHVKVNRQTLMQAMNRAAILTNEKFRGVRVGAGENSLKIIAANAEQEEAQEEMEVDYSGDAIDVGFNVGYLLDVLNNVQTDRNSMEFQRRQFQRANHVPGNERFKYVVMPMRI
jgi:DNA polymerase-3 subunit beta